LSRTGRCRSPHIGLMASAANEAGRKDGTDDGVLVLAGLVEVEQRPGGESKDHALVVLAQLIVDLGGHERGQLPLGKGLIFAEGLAAAS
jgi:hypothetical protein